MTCDASENRDEILERLLVEYDKVLAGETPAGAFDESLLGADPDLATEWARAKECVELLRKAGARAILSLPVVSGAEANLTGDAPSAFQPQRVGRFVIERELGHGGLGVVFLARDPRLGRRVAVKVPRFEALLSDDLRRRFLREAEAAARLAHPHIVTLHEVGEDGAICYLASEYCEGPTLAQWLRDRSAPVPPRMAAAIVRQLAEGVEHAHGRGVLHRDIKPSNVLLREAAAGADRADDLLLAAKLTDFGMAKLLESTGEETRTGAIIGTPAYMAPEQAEGRIKDLDARTDIYALGAILYELLTGAPPYRGVNDIDTLRRLVTSELVAPRRVRREIPRDLEAIALKCLSKNPADRYATAHELAADLRRFLAREPTTARPSTPLQRATSWVRRRPALATLVALCLLSASLLALGGVLYTVRLGRYADELSQALSARVEARSLAQDRADETARSYQHDIRAAERAWRDGRVADATVLLAKHQPRAGEEDRRSFAWHYLWRLTQLKHTALSGHKGPVNVCRYSPDSRLLATGGEDGRVRLWDPTRGALVRSWAAHEKDIDGIAFSPDGKRLATMTEGPGAAVWELATGGLVHRFEQIDEPVLAVTFAPDGHTLVAAGEEGRVSLLDTGTWSLRDKFTTQPGAILQIAISPEGTVLATVGEAPAIRLWKFPEMQPIATLEGHERDITSIVFSDDGQKLASASRDGTIKLWNMRVYDLTTTYDRHAGYLYDVAFAPDGERVLAAGRGGVAALWDHVTDKPERLLRSGTSPVFSANIAPDGSQMATGGADELVHVWQGPPDLEKTKLVTGRPGRVVALSPDARVVAVGNDLGDTTLYDSSNCEVLNHVAAPEESVDWLSFSERADMLAAALSDRTVRLWRFPELTPVQTLIGHANRVRTVKFSPDGALVASCSDDKTVRTWDTADGQQRASYFLEEAARDVAFSPDSRLLAGAARDAAIYVWRVDDGVRLSKLAGHRDEALCVAWSPNGKLLASSAKDDSICLWDMTELALVTKITPNQGTIDSVAFSPDGRTLASCGNQRTIKLWDVDSKEEILLLAGHRRPIERVIFSRQDDFLLSFASGKPCELLFWPTRMSERPASP